jgi:hypothetical protein
MICAPRKVGVIWTDRPYRPQLNHMGTYNTDLLMRGNFIRYHEITGHIMGRIKAVKLREMEEI